jgi:hypothetical protein
VTQRSLEEDWIREEVQRVTQRSLEEAQIYEEVKKVTHRSLEEGLVGMTWMESCWIVSSTPSCKILDFGLT